MDNLQKIIKLAGKQGVELTIRPNGHIQIHGELLVNYYPNSERMTAYVAGTTKGYHRITPEQALQLAFNQPDKVKRPAKRKGKTRAKRARLLKKDNKCFWCGRELTLDTSTLEHKIPIIRGGLDNANNWALACEECNTGRGSEMTELAAVK